jgi:hypothetical protein
MTDHSYYNDEKDKLSSTNSQNSGTLKSCGYCGAPIILKLRELWEKQNPHNWLSWKRVLVERRWEAFDVNDVSRRHTCKEQQLQQQETLEQWTGI